MKLKRIFQNKWAVIGVALICALLWGSAFPVLKISNVELQMPPGDPIAQMVFAGIRFLLAGLIILLFLLVTNRAALYLKRQHLLGLVFLGIIQTALQYFFFYNGLANISGMQAAVLSSSGAFFAVILAHFFYKNDRLNWKKVIGIIAGFAGIMVANWGQEFQLSFQLAGEGFMILSGIAAAVATILSKQLTIGIHPFAVAGWQFTFGSIVLLVVGIPQLSDNAITFTPFGYGLLIYAAFLSAVAFALWNCLLKYNKAGEISIYKFLTPVSGAILSALFIPGEYLNIYILAAIALVGAGIFVINYRGKQRHPSLLEKKKASS